MTPLDTRHVGPPQDAAWRLHAVKLAVERKLAGRARHTGAARQWWTYAVASNSSPADHEVAWDQLTDSMTCDCPAGQHGQPCAHAGAAFLLVRSLAPDDRGAAR